jgi:hypothetical protein
MAGEIFEALSRLNEDRERTLIDGDSFCRWLLKVLYGAIASGNFSHQNKVVSFKDIEKRWLKVLFCNDEFPSDTGLFIFHRVGDKISFEKRVTVSILHIGSKVAGIKCSLVGVDFFLSLVPREEGFNVDQLDSQKHLIHKKIRLQYRHRVGRRNKIQFI